MNRKKTTRDVQTKSTTNAKLSSGVDVSAFVIKEVHDNDVSVKHHFFFIIIDFCWMKEENKENFIEIEYNISHPTMHVYIYIGICIL